MAIVFDQVVGTVEPESPPPPEEPVPPAMPVEPDGARLRRELRRLEQRRARLRAD